MSGDGHTVFVWNKSAPAHESYVQAGRHMAPAPVMHDWRVEQRRDRDGAVFNVRGPFHDASSARSAAERLAGEVRSPDRPVRLSESAPPAVRIQRPPRDEGLGVFVNAPGAGAMSAERARDTIREAVERPASGDAREAAPRALWGPDALYEQYVAPRLRGLSR